MSVSPDQFRRALRQWPSGVSVVTSFSSEPVGLTVSSFFSVSLVPPLVGVCLDRTSATLPVILATRLFGVSVLSAQQSDLSERFAGADERPALGGRRAAPGLSARSGARGGRSRALRRKPAAGLSAPGRTPVVSRFALSPTGRVRAGALSAGRNPLSSAALWSKIFYCLRRSE